MSIFIIMEIKDLIKQLLREQTDIKKQYPGWVNINVNTDRI